MIRLALAIPALLFACSGDETVSGYTPKGAVYVLDLVDGVPAPGGMRLAFPEQGKVAGSGPCSSFTASQDLPYPWIGIAGLTATRRACPGLAGEAAYFASLAEMTLVEALGDTLILRNDAGRELVFRTVTD